MGLEKRKFNKHLAEEQPAYSLTEASRYLSIPPATLRSWVAGRKYPTGSGPKFFRPVIELPDDARAGLSFVNLVEAHVLDAELARLLPRIAAQFVEAAGRLRAC